MRRTAIGLSCLFALCFAFTTPAHAQPPEIPAAWAGIWDLMTIERDCTTGNITDQYSEPDTLCAGTLFDADPDFEENCTGTIDDTNADVSCESTFEAFPGCNSTFTYTVMAARVGETYSGDGQWTVTFVGACMGAPDMCVDFEVSANRTGPEPAECMTPVEPASWGHVKANYR